MRHCCNRWHSFCCSNSFWCRFQQLLLCCCLFTSFRCLIQLLYKLTLPLSLLFHTTLPCAMVNWSGWLLLVEDMPENGRTALCCACTQQPSLMADPRNTWQQQPNISDATLI